MWQNKKEKKCRPSQSQKCREFTTSMLKRNHEDSKNGQIWKAKRRHSFWLRYPPSPRRLTSSLGLTPSPPYRDDIVYGRPLNVFCFIDHFMKLLNVLRLDFILSTFVKVRLTLQVVRTYLPPEHFEQCSQLRESNEWVEKTKEKVVTFSVVFHYRIEK